MEKAGMHILFFVLLVTAAASCGDTSSHRKERKLKRIGFRNGLDTYWTRGGEEPLLFQLFHMQMPTGS